jgi:protein-S-isoprenylcysteine O-methyltransferase Ste14
MRFVAVRRAGVRFPSQQDRAHRGEISARIACRLLMMLGFFILHFSIVIRKERYLNRKFGDDYHHYKMAVPRYMRLV